MSASSARFPYVLGVAVLVLAGLWYGFMAIDGVGLKKDFQLTVVRGKTFREAGQTYTREIINNRTYTVAQSRPETYALELELNGGRAVGFVERSLYEAVEPGDTVRVIYQRRRLTGGIDVLQVTRP